MDEDPEHNVGGAFHPVATASTSPEAGLRDVHGDPTSAQLRVVGGCLAGGGDPWLDGWLFVRQPTP